MEQKNNKKKKQISTHELNIIIILLLFALNITEIVQIYQQIFRFFV